MKPEDNDQRSADVVGERRGVVNAYTRATWPEERAPLANILSEILSGDIGVVEVRVSGQ